MHADIGILTIDHDNNYFDITHSFKIDSFTYHVLGLRKDRPTYGNNYYIFNCPDCPDEQHDLYRPTPKSLPVIRTSQIFERRSTSEKRTTVQTQSSSTNRHRASSATPKKVESTTITMEQTMAELLKTEHNTLVSSLRRAMKAENETLLRSIKATPKKVENETIAIEQKLNEIVNQTLITEFRREMKEENEILFRSIKEEEKIFIQESTVSNVNKEEIIRLLEQQKRSLEILYEKQIRTIDSSIDRFIHTVTQVTNTQHESSPALNQLQLMLVQTIEKEVQQTLLKSVEKFESMTLTISQLKHTFEQTIEKQSTTTTTNKDDAGLLNRLFVEQKKFLIDTLEQQEQRLKRIVRETLVGENSSSLTTENHHHNLPNEQTTDHPLRVNQVSSNEPDQHLFKVSIKSPEPVRLYAKLFIGGIEYPRKSHTLCQQDPNHADEVTCYVAPPAVDGPYEVIIYAKTNTETAYRAAMSIRLPGASITQSVFFPYTFPSFEIHQCILIQPLQSFVRHNELVLIHMVLPGAHMIKIRNGNDAIVLDRKEYINGVVKKEVQARGDVYVYGRWGNETDSAVCLFYVI